MNQNQQAPLPYITRGQRDALILALKAAGDAGFIETAIALSIPDPHAAWKIFTAERWLVRCLDCGNWVAPAQMSKRLDICAACEIPT